MNKRILDESENSTKNVCYLIITHGMWVDQCAHIFDYLESSSMFHIPNSYFCDMGGEEKEKMVKELE